MSNRIPKWVGAVALERGVQCLITGYAERFTGQPDTWNVVAIGSSQPNTVPGDLLTTDPTDPNTYRGARDRLAAALGAPAEAVADGCRFWWSQGHDSWRLRAGDFAPMVRKPGDGIAWFPSGWRHDPAHTGDHDPWRELLFARDVRGNERRPQALTRAWSEHLERKARQAGVHRGS